MPGQNVALKVVVTPRWVVVLPSTSGPVAFFLATDQGATHVVAMPAILR